MTAETAPSPTPDTMAESNLTGTSSDCFFRATLRPDSPDLARFDETGNLGILPPGEALLREWQSALDWNPSVPSPATCVFPRGFTGILSLGGGQLAPRDFLVAVFETAGGGGLQNWNVESMTILPMESRRAPTVRHYLASYARRLYWSSISFRPGRIYSGLRSRVLPATTTWTCIGDPTLLDFPFLRLAALPQPKPIGYFGDAIREHVRAAVEGRVLLSAFIMPPEKEILRQILKFSTTRFIRILPHGIPHDYRPSPFEAKLVESGRLLLLSGFPPHVFPRMPDAGLLNQSLSWSRQIAAAADR